MASTGAFAALSRTGPKALCPSVAPSDAGSNVAGRTSVQAHRERDELRHLARSKVVVAHDDEEFATVR
jgi:hypothetical protein